MKINKIKVISFGIIFLICLNNFMIYLPTQNYDTQSLKTSAGEITIITPENKTYNEPMSGHYPATYSFENDADETSSLEGWDNPTGGISYLKVVSERFGRKKVIEAYDGGSGTGWIASHYFNNTEGTIEFWWAVSSVASLKSHMVVVLSSTLDPLFGVQVLSGQIQVLTGGIWFDISGLTTTANTWDHVRLDFRSDSGSAYEGMNQNQYRLYYNGIDEGSYNFQNIGNPNLTRLYSGLAPVDTYGYYDAIGFSWDLDYSIGDNLDEGLLLSFENTTALDWRGYSLDGNTNKTISGNKTIPMPSYGGHSIQVFGNNTLGTMYQSNKVFFTTTKFPINLLSPENKTYTQPMSGYYPATYSFENDMGGSDPSDFTVWEGGGAVLIRDSYMGHNKSVQLYDWIATDYVGIHDIFDSNQTTGTIEAFVSFTHTNKHHEFSIRDGSWSDSIAFAFIDGYLYYYTGGGWVNILGSSFIAYKWYHVKIEFDCSDAWHLWIDGIRIDNGDGFEFNGNPTEMDRVYFATHNSDANYNYFIDAIGYSWDENYYVGDNLHEGLLLDYETNEDLVWNGYSLDNKANITITGNKVLSMPRNGTHTIQVFGNDSLGDIFQSEKRYFTMHYNSVDIITPENITYTTPMDGYFPGTFGFENDQDGDIPDGWVNYTGTGHKIEVIEEKYGHKKVVELRDNSDSYYPLMVNVFKSPQPIGTIEFWIATTDKTKETYLSFKDASGLIAFAVEIKSSSLRFLYQGPKYLIHAIENHVWYHIRIDFNCVTHKVTYWLNNALVGANLAYYRTVGNIEKIHVNTLETHAGYSSYLDALAYSWDPFYHVGDNYDEGLLFSYDGDNSDFAWREFSLDGQPRQLILGHKTLPVPEDGTHTIQFFAQDYLGDYYESDLRFFTVEIAPSVEWTFPENGSTVILPYTKAPHTNDGLFTFHYNSRLIDDIELEIDGTNLGSVWNTNSIVLNPFGDYTDKGFLSATLIGKNGSTIVATDTRSFQFVKITFEYTQILNSSTQIIGKQLYLILHDPHGDNSFSSISESTTLSIGVGSVITNALGVSIEVGAEFSLFGVNAGASVLLEAKETVTQEYDFRYEITETTSLTSSQVNDDAEYIGPGYGDRYWGESWIYKWVLNGTERTYSNGTIRWEKPKLYYGILRGVETFASDEHAPTEWKTQNAVYNDTLPVSWITPFQESGGAPYVFENEVTTTTRRTSSFQIFLGADFMAKFGPVETHATIELSVRNYAEAEIGNVHKVAYHIEDDDPSDFLVQWIGIDEQFGTYIFEGDSFLCETSSPLEHNTYDYLPPEIDFPTITFDTNSDNTGPADDDSPLVRVNIFEEGDLQTVFISYSIDNGTTWTPFSLNEILASPGIWEGSIPSFAQNTKVLWYVIALDAQGNRAERKDIYGDPFEYTVVAKPFVPSYPPILIVLSLMIPIGALLLRYRKKIYTIKS